MGTQEALMMLSQFVLGALATFLAILVWSKSRDTAWMLIVVGTVAHYGQIVLTALETIGVIRLDFVTFGEVAVFPLVLTNLPTLFYIVAFLILVSRKIN